MTIRLTILFLIHLSFTPYIKADISSAAGQISFDVDSDGNHEMLLNETGVGIGTNSPTSKLTVNGNSIISQSLSVGGTSSGANLSIFGTISHNPQFISSNIIASNSSMILVNTEQAGANLSITLPEARDYPNRLYTIKKITQNHDVFVYGFMDNYEMTVLSSNATLPYLKVISDGTAWYILSQTSYLETVEVTASENLLSYWRLDDESGTTATDSSNGNYDATLTSMDFETNKIDAVIHDGLSFDGSTEYMTVGDIDEIELRSVSFSFWMQLNATDRDYDFITKGNHSTNQPLLIWFDDSVSGTADSGDFNSNTISVLSYDGSVMHWVAGTNNAINDTDWHHIGVVIDSENNQLSIYIDGNLNNSNVKSWGGINSGSQSVKIATALNNVNKVDGSMDDIRIYNKVLSADDMSNLFSLGR